MNRQRAVTITVLLLLLLTTAGAAAAKQLTSVQVTSTGIEFGIGAAVKGSLTLVIGGPGDFRYEQTFPASGPLFVAASEFLGANPVAGSYTWNLTLNREGIQDRGDRTRATTQSGAFTVLEGGILANSSLVERSGMTKDQVFVDDVIVNGGSICVGFDCVNGESFGFDTIRLKENNLRIHYQDTSTSASFPSNDWRSVANDTGNGGANYYGIEDSNTGRIPFRIEAGARNHALYVEQDGDVGIGTENPAVDLEIVSGNTPTMRLQQDGTSGFTPQTFDVAANEANFFVRDVTNGSKLIFRIRPGGPESSIDIASNGDVGVGTSSPQASLHVRRTNATANLLVEEVNGTAATRNLMTLTNNGGVGLTLRDSRDPVGTDEWIVRSFSGNTLFQVTKEGSGNVELQLSDTGDLTINGQCSEGVSGSCADYVFEPDYELRSLEELSEFIAENGHLPNVPSTEQIKKNGLKVQHFQGRLLEKIEELTLYTLAQEDTINELKARLAALENPEAAN